MPFWYWLSSLFLGKTTALCRLLYLRNETILAHVYLCRRETNKDNYCQRIPFILCAESASGESTCCSQSRLVCWDNQPRLLCYLFIPCSRALSNSYYTAGPGQCLGLQNKAPHFRLETLCIWAYCFKQKKKKKSIETAVREKTGEGERERERKRRRETAAVGEYRSSSILMCANSPAPAD